MFKEFFDLFRKENLLQQAYNRSQEMLEACGLSLDAMPSLFEGPEVTGALRALADRGLVNYAPYEHVTLTGQGADVAREVLRKHEGIRDFLVKVLSVDKDIADKTAHNMEHAISSDVLERFIQFVDYLALCPRAGKSWAEEFSHYLEHPGVDENCEQCLTFSLEDFRARKSRIAEASIFLNDIKPGAKVKVVSVEGNGETRRRIVDMGMTPGTGLSSR